MQRLGQGALVALAPAGSELWLDGGHNPDGGRAVAAALADLEERVSRPLVLIVGMLATKDCAGFLRNFTGLARRMIAVPVPNAEKGMSAEAVADAARAIGLPATSRDNLGEAMEAARKLDLDPPPRILITGSLYLAGEVLRENGTPPHVTMKTAGDEPAILELTSRARSHRAADPLLQLLLRRGADLARGDLAVLEHHQRRDRHDAVFGGDVAGSRRH